MVRYQGSDWHFWGCISRAALGYDDGDDSRNCPSILEQVGLLPLNSSRVYRYLLAIHLGKV